MIKRGLLYFEHRVNLLLTFVTNRSILFIIYLLETGYQSMSKISLVVGNGLSISFAYHSEIFTKHNSQQPLDWDIKCPSTGNLLIASFPNLKKLFVENEDKNHFDIFALALDKDYCRSISLDSSKTILEARHFLTIAFSEYSLLQSNNLNLDWKWFEWINLHKARINGAFSLNYDLLLESVFDKLAMTYCSLQVNHDRKGIPLVKPHGSVDFEIADGIFNIGKMQYPITNFFIDKNDVPIKRLPSNNLLYPRVQAHCIIPNQANEYKDYQWVKPANEWFESVLKESKYCLFIGISYFPCDRNEIDRIVDSLPQDCEIIIANPSPPNDFLEKIKGRQYTVWSSSDGPIDESGNLYSLK